MSDIDKTLNYYNENAQSFASGTVSVKFTEVQDKFLEKLNPDAYILDFGCGAGRDTKYFLSRGYQVDAVDGSEQLCRIASEYTEIKVRQMLFQELDEKEKYEQLGSAIASAITSSVNKEIDEIRKEFSDSLSENILSIATRAEGIANSFGVHAAGVIIGDGQPLKEIIPPFPV